MDLSQTKLTKTEWNNIEVPLADAEKTILQFIIEGYTNVNLKKNSNLSLVSIAKIEPNPEIHYQLYKLYFECMITNIISTTTTLSEWKTIKNNVNWKQITEFTQQDVKKLKKLKKIDSMRIENLRSTIDSQTKNIIEFSQLEFCNNAIKSVVKQTNDYAFYVYTLFHLKKTSIRELNPYVVSFVELVINLAISMNPTMIHDIVMSSPKVIEKNQYILKYQDQTLYNHQKQLFSLFNNVENKPTTSKLVLYIAPTGTGKTLSPIGLSENHRIIFVCAVRHVGLSLARSAISMEKKVAFAFGCNTASDIRLHYYSALDYTRSKKSGSIVKVDNSNGANVEIMICDVKSYLIAMYYMESFNEKENIIMYWDEPTISLDYETHELHAEIKSVWEKNQIPNIILSCATLPDEFEICDTLNNFRERFDNPEITTIKSYDCKKTISILDSNSVCVVPHVLFSDYRDLKSCLENCDKNKSILRYFDLDEIVKFIKYVRDNNYIEKCYFIENYFKDIRDITMTSIKLYYIGLLNSIIQCDWDDIYVHFIDTQTPRTAVSTTTLVPGAMITTYDAHTLTDGPTIFLAENVEKIGKFCISQANIPNRIYDYILKKIAENNVLQEKIEIKVKELEDKLGNDANKTNKMESSRTSPEVRRLMDCIEEMRENVQCVSLDTQYIPNTVQHQQIWNSLGEIVKTAFVPEIDDDEIKTVMGLNVDTYLKILLLLGVGVFSLESDTSYVELIKKMAYSQKLFVVIATSDYIYGTNYNFCHGFLGKDLYNMTQQKIIQSIGRIGRGNIQQTYTVRIRDMDIIRKLFLTADTNVEAENMQRLFV
jgi:hypothetical protein